MRIDRERHHWAPELLALGRFRLVHDLSPGGRAHGRVGTRDVSRDWTDAGACLTCAPWGSEIDHVEDIPGVTVEISDAATSDVTHHAIVHLLAAKLRPTN
jgi:hypothetical protein